MTVLQDLVAALDAASELLARSSNPFERAYGRHFEQDAKSVRLMLLREPAEVVGT